MVDRYVLLGLAIMLVSEAATLAGVEPFASWNTPMCWTGFIIFADAVVFRARGNSWIRSSPREFAALTFASIPLWLVFEGYNLVIRNWNYVGLPDNPAPRLFGYAWSFATIWPAIFEGAELMAVWRRKVRLEPDATYDHSGHENAFVLSCLLGAAMLISPLLAPAPIAPYLAAPVWLGFIFLLDPINGRLGAESLSGDLACGRHDRAMNLVLSGFLCGVLWELWNYWSRAKWHYTVPILERLKVFEMPLPGYLGFPAFALECFTMYVFVRRLYGYVAPGATGGRTIAL